MMTKQRKKYEKLLARSRVYAMAIFKYEKMAEENPLLTPYVERLRNRGMALVKRTERASNAV